MKLEILYEDNHIIAVNKKPGDITQGDKTGDTTLPDIIMDFIKKRDNKPGNVFLGVIHRLDRPTSGVVLFAKTSKGLSRFNQLFREDKVCKVYHALVEQPPVQEENPKLVHYLKKNEEQNKSYVVSKNSPGAREAVLAYRTLKQGTHFTLLEVKLFTGRHHQIRCQLSSIGSPIRGDLKYGAKRSGPKGSIGLHARTISFTHPISGKEVAITAPYPLDIDGAWKVANEK